MSLFSKHHFAQTHRDLIIKKNTTEIIKKSTMAAAASGTAGIVTTDLPILITIWANMISSIAKEHGVEMNKANSVKFITAVVAGTSAILSGTGLLSKILAFTGVCLLLGLGINCLVNAFYTYRLGKAFNAMCADPSQRTAIQQLSFIIIKQMLIVPKISEIKEFCSTYKGA